MVNRVTLSIPVDPLARYAHRCCSHLRSEQSGARGAPTRGRVRQARGCLTASESGPPCSVPSTLGLTNPFSITPGLNRLLRTIAESTLRIFYGYGLRGKSPARPTLTPCIRFLSIDSRICSTLLSAPPRSGSPCVFATPYLHQVLFGALLTSGAGSHPGSELGRGRKRADRDANFGDNLCFRPRGARLENACAKSKRICRSNSSRTGRQYCAVDSIPASSTPCSLSHVNKWHNSLGIVVKRRRSGFAAGADASMTTTIRTFLGMLVPAILPVIAPSWRENSRKRAQRH
jgi:hypothetical protein